MKKLKEELKKITMLRKIVSFLKSHFNSNRNAYTDIRKELEKQDRLNALQREELLPLHQKLKELRRDQTKNWDSFVYCDGYFYQGYSRIGTIFRRLDNPCQKNKLDFKLEIAKHKYQY